MMNNTDCWFEDTKQEQRTAGTLLPPLIDHSEKVPVGATDLWGVLVRLPGHLPRVPEIAVDLAAAAVRQRVES